MKPTETRAVRFVRASPETVFAAWTRPELVQQWWGPPPYTCPEAVIDLRVGGQYRLANAHPDGHVIWITGEFVTVEPPRRLSYSWRLSTWLAGPSLVHVEFLPHPDGCEVRVHHERFTDVTARDEHADGWAGCLAALGAFLERSVE